LNWTNLDASYTYIIQEIKGIPANMLLALKLSACSKISSLGKGTEHDRVRGR
jgi:hypothetical protein